MFMQLAAQKWLRVQLRQIEKYKSYTLFYSLFFCTFERSYLLCYCKLLRRHMLQIIIAIISMAVWK